MKEKYSFSVVIFISLSRGARSKLYQKKDSVTKVQSYQNYT